MCLELAAVLGGANVGGGVAIGITTERLELILLSAIGEQRHRTIKKGLIRQGAILK